MNSAEPTRVRRSRWFEPAGPDAVKNRVITSIASNYVALGAQIAYTLVMTPYLVATLGVESFGAWAIVLSAIGYLLIIDLGIAPSTARFVAAAQTTNALNGVVATSLAMLSVAGLLALVVGVGIASISPTVFGQIDGLQESLAIAAVLAAVQLPLAVFSNVLYGLQRIVERNTLIFARILGKAGLGVLAVELGGGLVAFVAAAAAAELVILLAQAAWCLRTVPGLSPKLRDVKWSRARELVPFSVGVLGLTVATQLTTYSDALVIGAFGGAAVVAIYAVAMRVVTGLATLLAQIPNVYMPRFAELDAAGDIARSRQIVSLGTRMLLVIGFPLLALVVGLGHPLLQAWVGEGFDDAWLPLALLSGGLAFNAPLYFAVFWALGAARHRRIAAYSVIDAVANVGLSLILVHPLGMNGVALATLIALAVSNGYFIPRVIFADLGTSIWRGYYGPLLRATAVAVPASAILYFVVAPAIENSASLLALSSGVSVVVVSATIAAVLFTAHERRGARNLLKSRTAVLAA